MPRLWILNSKSWDLESSLGGYRIRVVNDSLFNPFKGKQKTEVTLSRLNLRLGGYSIWSAATRRTPYLKISEDF